MLAANPVELDLHLPSGRLHAQRFGAATAPLVLCLPGLTANRSRSTSWESAWDQTTSKSWHWTFAAAARAT